MLQRQDKTSNFRERITEIKTLDDIEVYEKAYGCIFTYISSWDKKEVYKAKKFVSKENNNQFIGKMISVAESNKSQCKENTIITFALDNGEFRIKFN